MHTNIGCCALFAATSGSSVATAATIGTVALPSLKRYGYPMPDSLGSLAAAGRGIMGGEVTQVTGIIHEGRQEAFKRMISEASHHGGIEGVRGGHQHRGAGFDGRPERVGQRRELD